jgi:hypothetical protein
MFCLVIGSLEFIWDLEFGYWNLSYWTTDPITRRE